MKKVLVLSAALLLCAGVASAQMAGEIGMFADPLGANCFLSDAVAGLCTYNVVHVWSPGATASQFRALKPACLLAVYLSDTAVFPVTIGNSQNGVAIGYGACLASPINVLKINFFCQGLTGRCCEYAVTPDPNVPSGKVEVVNCQNQLLFASALSGRINGSPAECECDPRVPTEDATWGKVKALYYD